jgi:hypothetical protein
MSSRVRKRSLGWRSQDPVGGGPKREIQITEHACSKSAVYPLWTRAFDTPALPPRETTHLNRGGSFATRRRSRRRVTGAIIVVDVPTGEQVTRYATGATAHIAYQVLGRAIVIVPGLCSHLEVQWQDAAYRSFARRLAAFSTVIRFDKRGTGLSDPVIQLPTLEERLADLATVIAAAGAERPVLSGSCSRATWADFNSTRSPRYRSLKPLPRPTGRRVGF